MALSCSSSAASSWPLSASSSLRGRMCSWEATRPNTATTKRRSKEASRQREASSVSDGRSEMAVLERDVQKRSDTATETSGNAALVDALRQWGITFYAGVNGGGVVHVAKHLEPYTDLTQTGDGVARMLTVGEYVAGFTPIGHYLATGRIAGCVTTTGAATKLGGSGMTDAKLHNIPGVWLIALNSTMSIGNAPLQDVSEHGMNVIPQLEAELGEGCVVVDSVHSLEDGL